MPFGKIQLICLVFLDRHLFWSIKVIFGLMTSLVVISLCLFESYIFFNITFICEIFRLWDYFYIPIKPQLISYQLYVKLGDINAIFLYVKTTRHWHHVVIKTMYKTAECLLVVALIVGTIICLKAKVLQDSRLLAQEAT